MKLTLSQKRFLIVWIGFHSFALFVNLAKIYGYTSTDSQYKDSIGTKVYVTEYLNVFTSGTKDDFWPFTTYIEKSISYPSYSDGRVEIHGFNGIFNSCDYRAFIFYIIIGFGMVYLPKLWSDKEHANNE